MRKYFLQFIHSSYTPVTIQRHITSKWISVIHSHTDYKSNIFKALIDVHYKKLCIVISNAFCWVIGRHHRKAQRRNSMHIQLWKRQINHGDKSQIGSPCLWRLKVTTIERSMFILAYSS